MESHFVTQDSSFYDQAFQLRKALFFKDFENANELLNDAFEAESYHLIIEKNNKILGTGRLTVIENNIGIISQMAVVLTCQYKGVGKKIMSLLLVKCSELRVDKVRLSARITALSFYEKFGFIAIDQVYPSKKTGVLHQQMELVLA